MDFDTSIRVCRVRRNCTTPHAGHEKGGRMYAYMLVGVLYVSPLVLPFTALFYFHPVQVPEGLGLIFIFYLSPSVSLHSVLSLSPSAGVIPIFSTQSNTLYPDR